MRLRIQPFNRQKMIVPSFQSDHDIPAGECVHLFVGVDRAVGHSLTFCVAKFYTQNTRFSRRHSRLHLFLLILVLVEFLLSVTHCRSKSVITSSSNRGFVITVASLHLGIIIFATALLKISGSRRGCYTSAVEISDKCVFNVNTDCHPLSPLLVQFSHSILARFPSNFAAAE